MNQVKIAPNIEIAIISVNELSGYTTFNKVASAMPELDSSNAFSGMPFLLILSVVYAVFFRKARAPVAAELSNV